MKKTLIALAAVAATGAAFAQSSVTLSGKYAFAYQDQTSHAGLKTKGFLTTDGNVTFAAVEDLGGGMKAGASMDVKVRGRNATPGSTIDGRDATVYLQGGFGRITLGAVEAGNGIIGRASAGAPTIGLDNGTSLDAATNVDLAAYSIAMNGFMGTVQFTDSIGAPGAGGITTAGVPGFRGVTIGGGYAAGPVDAYLDFTKFNNPPAAPADIKNRIRVSGSYDLGVVKLGAGYQAKKYNTVGSATNKQYQLGVSAPFGPVTVGGTYAKHDAGGGVTFKSWEMGANYAFSKRTNVQVAYQNINPSAAASAALLAGATGKQKTFRVRMMHAF